MTAVEKKSEKAGRYDFAAIEERWQQFWREHSTFKTYNPGQSGATANKPKFYILDFFPYPSGSGLHVGHPLGYCATDIIARHKRMCGYNVLHPMGFDSFGLPAEQYAIETNVHPAVTTRKNIDTYRQQLRKLGFSYDWDRELATSDPTFYKFTQWMFVRMFESWYDPHCRWRGPDGAEQVGRARPISELTGELEQGHRRIDPFGQLERADASPQGRLWSELSPEEQRRVIDGQRLAFIDEIPVNWCPALGTVLANEEVTNEGRSDRGNHPVYRRPLRQWMLRITRYADRLLADLDDVDWPEPIKLMQRNWIGRSTGAEVVFPLADKWAIKSGSWTRLDPSTSLKGGLSYTNFAHAIRIYTTRPDTLFGATYMVLAPEHELVDQITTPQQRGAVDLYVTEARQRTELDRTAATKEKTGVFTGAFAINPVNGDRIPIWIADYVLAGYGTGAIMAVPGGDTRDFEFAQAFGLEIKTVVRPPLAWIEEQIAAMAPRIDESAADGFAQALHEFPELSDEIAARRKASRSLGTKTEKVLRESVGLERLTDHYTKHAVSWGEAYTGEGIAIQSPAGSETLDVPGGVCALNGLATSEAKERIIAWLEEAGVGRGAVNYKLRDWVFSRQKYWGEPFPVLHGEDGETISVIDDELPVELPEVEDFKPAKVADDQDSPPEPPLSRARDWITVERNGRRYRRDHNTMPQWAGSCWYYLRFIDPKNSERFCDEEAERYWMPVDLYLGGAEHAVLHLLYARFWHKLLYDRGLVSTCEPFQKLFNQGMIQSFAYRDPRGITVGEDQVDQRGDEEYFLKESGEPVTRIVAKMSKALKNVVNPDQVIEQYGADTFRLYEMYMGPLDASKPWNTRDVPGLFKLCQRIWRLVIDERTGSLSSELSNDAPDAAALRALHKMIKRVTEDLDQLKFNTAIAAIFDFVNFMTGCKQRPRAVIEEFVKVLSPFAPHLGEELWRRLGHSESIAYAPWPTLDADLARDEMVEIGVQIAGKIKARVMVSADAEEAAIESAALADERVQAALANKTVRKVIVVKGRLVNIVAS